jgi:hypothetical protein
METYHCIVIGIIILVLFYAIYKYNTVEQFDETYGPYKLSPRSIYNPNYFRYNRTNPFSSIEYGYNTYGSDLYDAYGSNNFNLYTTYVSPRSPDYDGRYDPVL